MTDEDRQHLADAAAGHQLSEQTWQRAAAAALLEIFERLDQIERRILDLPGDIPGCEYSPDRY